MDNINILKETDNLLKEIVKFLVEKNIELSENMQDGRINSAINEDEIIEILKKISYKGYQLIEGLPRDWSDIYFVKINEKNKPHITNLINIHSKYKKQKNKNMQNQLKSEWIDNLMKINNNYSLIPINIKISTTTTNDNINSKEGLYFSLTGKIYNKANNWNTFFKSLKENLSDNEPYQDYFFLVINKNNTKDIFFNSLRRIKKFTPNGNNLPFQVKWNENKEPYQGNFLEAKKRILDALGKSLKQRAQPWFIFKNIFSKEINTNE